MIKDVNLSKFYSSFISFISLISLLNDIPLTFSMSAILLKLLIQSNCHLLGKRILCWNQQLSMTKTKQNEHLRRFWIHNIQNQIIIFSTRFNNLTVTLILLDITQTVINFKTHLKLYRNIMHNTLTNQIHSLLNWDWFIINQQKQIKKKFRTQSQRLF